jgi:hypothetical protein
LAKQTAVHLANVPEFLLAHVETPPGIGEKERDSMPVVRGGALAHGGPPARLGGTAGELIMDVTAMAFSPVCANVLEGSFLDLVFVLVVMTPGVSRNEHKVSAGMSAVPAVKVNVALA